jgi:RND family efflux transporter MFP subunit
VRAGDVLADVETPDLDRQLDQAKADRDRARSALALARRNLERWEPLAADNAVSKVEVDERRTTVEDATGALAAAEANVHRLATLQGFARLVAPFTGVITARNLDVGTLVTPGTTPGGRGLYSIAQIDTVRLLVDVPQGAVTDVHTGVPADVSIRELGARAFQGKVSRTADALDPASRTQRVEVWVPNPDGALRPGMYAEVRFQLTRSRPPVVVPASVIVVHSEGPQVALLGPDGAVHFKPVTLGRDYGGQVEIVSGVAEGDRLVLSPSDDVLDGSRAHAAANPEDAER